MSPKSSAAAAGMQPLLEEAVIHHKAGKLEAAKQLYLQLIEYYPKQAPVHNLLGLLYQQEGKFTEAETELQKALKIAPNEVEYLRNLAHALKAAGKLDQAAKIFRKALAVKPQDIGNLRGLGLTLRDLGKVEESIPVLQQAIKLDPNSVDLMNTLGNQLRLLKRYKEAREMFDEALKRKPDFAEGWCNLGNVARDEGKILEAVDYYKRAIAISPQIDKLYANLGMALQGMDKVEEAIAAFQQAVTLNPRFYDAWNSLGVMLMRAKQYPEAERCYQHALSVKPDYVEALTNLGNLFATRGDLETAENWYRKAEALQGGSQFAAIKRALMLPVIMESEEQIRETRAKLEQNLDALMEKKIRVEDPLMHLGQTAFYLAYHGKNDAELQKKLAKFYSGIFAGLDYKAPHIGKKRAEGKLRIGFISTFLKGHTIGKLNEGLIRELDRNAFQVEVFTTFQPQDALSQRIMESADHYHILPLNLERAREKIAERALDIIFYTDIGMEPFTYFLGFARLAPLQCMTWGHPDTTALPHIDYFISSNDLDTEQGQAAYTEKLACLGKLAVCYKKPEFAGLTKSAKDFGLPEDANLYVCPQSLFKFHPDFDPVLAEILRRDPKGVLVLIASVDDVARIKLEARFKAHMPDVMERIIFMPRLSGSDFLQLCALSQVSLDPLHFGGGNTTYEALSVGTPVVTLPSEFLRGRISYALYKQMGYEECVASSVKDYIEKSLKLGTDRSYRQKVSGDIQQRHGLLFEDLEGVRMLEDWFKAHL